jgi:hypothetical protein
MFLPVLPGVAVVVRRACDVHILIAPWVMRFGSSVQNGALVDAHVHEPFVTHAVLGGLVEREDCGGSTSPTNLKIIRIVCAGASFDAHVREPLAARAVLGGLVEREDRITSLARRWMAPPPSKARMLDAAVRLLVLRHVEERREEKEDTDADGHDSGGELAAGVDGRAAWRIGAGVVRREKRIRGHVDMRHAGRVWVGVITGAGRRRACRRSRGNGETGGRVPVRGTVSGPCLASCAPLMRTLAGTPAIASVYDKDSQNRRLAEMSANQLFTKSATKYKV